MADLWLYPTDQGGRKAPAPPGWGCPCTTQQTEGDGWVGYDGWPLLADVPMARGQIRTVGFVFSSGEEAASLFRAAGKFYLWEGRIVGEATVIGTEEISG